MLLALILLCTQACQQDNINSTTLYAFGTLIDFKTFGLNNANNQAALTYLNQQLSHMDTQWSAWGDGELGKINQQLQLGETASISKSMHTVLELGIQLQSQSDGNFAVDLGRLIELWQFNQQNHAVSKPPDSEKIQSLFAQPTSLTLTTDSISSNQSVILDLGGFAKGVALDILKNGLHDLGIENALVNAGGDLVVLGKKGHQFWTIGIRHPRNNGVFALIKAKPGDSIMTSGDYERFFIYEGKRYHHVIDPQTGQPSRDFQSVTVIHPNAALADAAATALMIAGLDNWQSLALKLGVTQVLCVDQKGTVWATPSMKRSVQLISDDFKFAENDT